MKPGDLAAALPGYKDRWVAIRRNRMLTDQDSFSDTVAWLRTHNIKADAVFHVPEDPAATCMKEYARHGEVQLIGLDDLYGNLWRRSDPR